MLHLLPPELIRVDQDKLALIDDQVKGIYRLVTFSRAHTADDLLDRFISSNNNLTQLLSIKNAQMEAQDENEARVYLKNLDRAIDFVMDEIKAHRNFLDRTQLFQLFRLVSPEAHQKHPNSFRHSLVQIGSTICPAPQEVPFLITELFRLFPGISHPLIRAIYLHHELIRIHPFSDGNGRTTRIAKNWMLMHDLYPPIFIRDEQEKQEYIRTLAESFSALDAEPLKWNPATAHFFDAELERVRVNAEQVYNDIR